jgi:hypothetical protein
MSKQEVYLIAHREKPRRTESDLIVQQEYGIEPFTPMPDYYKIGISENVKSRLSILSSGTPHSLNLVTTIEADDPKEVEEYLHRYNMNPFDDRGEWFSLDYNMVNSLKALEHLKAKNVKQVYHNKQNIGLYESFYVAIHRARNGKLPTWEEIVA